MKLISEQWSDEVNYLVEEDPKTGKKHAYIEGVMLQTEVKNKNGRIYPKEVMQKEVKRYNKEFVEQDRAFGELGHPEGPTINLDKVSHMITKLEEDGNNYVGRAKILSTPNGQIVRNLIDDGAKLGVSSRGLGSLEQKGGAQYVKDDFQLATAGDIVADPSAPEAFVNGIMEGVEWIYQHGRLTAQEIDEMHTEIKTGKSHKLEEITIKSWKRFVESL